MSHVSGEEEVVRRVIPLADLSAVDEALAGEDPGALKYIGDLIRAYFCVQP